MMPSLEMWSLYISDECLDQPPCQQEGEASSHLLMLGKLGTLSHNQIYSSDSHLQQSQSKLNHTTNDNAKILFNYQSLDVTALDCSLQHFVSLSLTQSMVAPALSNIFTTPTWHLLAAIISAVWCSSPCTSLFALCLKNNRTTSSDPAQAAYMRGVLSVRQFVSSTHAPTKQYLH